MTPTKAQLEPIVIDGKPARLRIGCGEMEALLDVDSRVFSFSGGSMAGSGFLVSPALRNAIPCLAHHHPPRPRLGGPAPGCNTDRPDRLDDLQFEPLRVLHRLSDVLVLDPAKYDWPKIGLPEKGGQTMDVFGQTPSGILVWVTSVPRNVRQRRGGIADRLR